MSKISLVIVFLLQAGTSFAQKYFVFIAAENRQPFYVRVDSEFHSSSAEGHIILSRLKDTTYTIAIGFPGQTLPEQHYRFSIHEKDQAFELRSQDANGLRLYDLQTNDWLSPQGGSGAGDDSRSAGIKKDDAFSRMMAGVVHDTAVLYNTYAMERALSDSPAVAAATPPSTTPTAPDPTVSQSGTNQSAITQAAINQSTTNQPIDSTTTASAIPPASVTAPPASTTPATSLPPPADGARHSSTTDTTSTLSAEATVSRPADTTVSRHTDTTAFRQTDTMTTAGQTDSTSSRPTPPPTQPAGAITHEPAPRFNDSSAAPLYRPIPKDSSVGAAPIPSAVGAPLFRSPGVVKLSERHSSKNVRLVYADHSGSKKADTIVVIIPVDSPAVDKTARRQPHVADSSRGPSTRPHGPKPNPNADSPTVAASTVARPKTSPAQPTELPRPRPADTPRHPTKATPFINSDCHDFASDFDVDKLRVRMLETAKDEDRIAVARKMFKSKCFTTPQIRALSEVFTSDAAKFRFFEAAWPFAADEHFHELSDLLADPVYNNKFKTMTHIQ